MKITKDNLKNIIMGILEEQNIYFGDDNPEMPLFTSRDVEDFAIDQLDDACEPVASIPLSDFIDILAERLVRFKIGI
jgi:hypothetical protein